MRDCPDSSEKKAKQINVSCFGADRIERKERDYFLKSNVFKYK